MAHGLNSVTRGAPASAARCKSDGKNGAGGGGGIGSRRIFAPHFKLQVLDSYRNDADCKGNQRATARKYGIHRRQIQKWLQCENNLRNSVGKSKAAVAAAAAALAPEARKCGVEVSLRGACQHRQRDDSLSEAYSLCADTHKEAAAAPYGASTGSPASRAGDPLVPDTYVPTSRDREPAPPLPLPAALTPLRDADSPDRASPSATASSSFAAPLDYTMRGRAVSASATTGAPMDLSFKRTTPSASPLASSSADIPSSPPPAPRLRQPDVWDLSVRRPCQKRRREDDSASSSSSSTTSESPPAKPVKLFKPYLLDDQLDDDKGVDASKGAPCELPPSCCGNRFVSSTHDDAQLYNNNNIYPDYGCYTLLEMQPKTTATFDYYTINKNYIYATDYDSLSMCSSYEYSSMQSQSSPPLRQRQSYSLDFKLSAIECYYQDSICRGNQRAVAHKYNIHRRQVQKWLKQEEDLRTRSDHVLKQASVVR